MKYKYKISKKKIYLDFASATPVSTEVKKVMRDVDNVYVNPDSIYSSGVKAKKIIEAARKSVAEILHGRSEEVVFTSGGTEGNNLVIFGLYNFLLKENPKRKFHIVTSTIEHSSVLEPIRELEKRGVKVTYVKPDLEGILDPKDIREALRPETFLVSIMYANNEIGTIQPIREISKVIRYFRKALSSKPLAPSYPFFHTDACQAPNYLDLNVELLGVDFMTLDGGKIYGPKSTGCIYKKKAIKLNPLFFGGGQENNVRSGTLNTSLIAGFSTALKRAIDLSSRESARLIKLRDYFIEKLIEKNDTISINGSLQKRLPNNVNICIKGLDAEFTVLALDVLGIECSYVSTCMNLKGSSDSYVIEEVSGKECASSSLRFTLGRTTSKKDLDYCIKSLRTVLFNQKMI